MTEFLTAHEVADWLKISIGKVRQLTYYKKLPVHHLGARVLYIPDEVEKAIRDNEKL
jgi:hypothetical protein